MVNQQFRVSVIATVFNEGSNIRDWLDGLLSQSRLPDEIVIVDGGSTDDTVETIEMVRNRAALPIRVQVSPGLNISQGRNRAIELTDGDVIVVTDAGTVADCNWLERLVRPVLDGEADVASGFFVPRLSTGWERALAASTLPDADEIDPDGFLPSSRSMAFRRRWFDLGIRYPEWLDYCEDLIWDMSMQRAGARFRFVPDAVVTFAVRPSPQAFALQYYRYARGDGRAGLFARRHLLRYLTYCGLAAVIVRRRKRELLVAALLGGGYVRQAIARLVKRDRAAGRPVGESVLLVPLVIALRALGDVAKMAGYPVGLRWRWRRYGRIGWRTSWRRISPSGELFRPGAMSTGNLPPPASPAVESHAESR